jgi:hypothetical protein
LQKGAGREAEGNSSGCVREIQGEEEIGMFEVLVIVHALFGLLGLLAGVWVFVDALNASQSNMARIRTASLLVAVAMWVSFI